MKQSSWKLTLKDLFIGTVESWQVYLRIDNLLLKYNDY